MRMGTASSRDDGYPDLSASMQAARERDEDEMMCICSNARCLRLSYIFQLSKASLFYTTSILLLLLSYSAIP